MNEVRAALTANLTESQLQKLVIDRARELGWLVHHCRPAMNKKGEWRTHIQGDKGFPDLVMARAHRVLFVELKTQTGRVSTEQDNWIYALPHWHTWRPRQWYDGTIDRALS